jgi:Protein of unknown function (DUF3830)
MTTLRIEAGPFEFSARMEEDGAPETCAAFQRLLPFESKLIHVRWSGESCWVPMGDFETNLDFENHTSHPAPGQILWYPGGFSETEILFPYGGCRFASIVGQLAGNHFLTVEGGGEQLKELGRLTLWEGAQPIGFFPGWFAP